MHSIVFEREQPAASVIAKSLAQTRSAVFWHEDAAAMAVQYARVAGDMRVDDAVVGGGYTGLWSAIKIKLKHPERRVALFEGKRIAWAASGRNGGFCEASLTHGEANGLNRWPQEMDVLNKLGLKNLDAIENFVAENKLDAEFERTGALTVANESHQVAWLQEEAGADSELLDAAGARARINSPTFLGAVFDAHENALVHPAKLAYELARFASEIGVEIYERTPILKLAAADDKVGIELQAKTGAIYAGRVVLGTNVFQSLLKRYRLHTVPVYDYVLMSEPLSDEQLASIGWQGREGLADMANQFHYSRLTRDNRILWGGYDAVYYAGGKVRAEYEEREESFKKLASHFFTTFPQLAGLQFTHKWAGAIDTCSRFCAFFGSAYDGRVQHAAGFTGLGVGATHFAADVMLDRLDAETTERTELAMVKEMPLPFPPEPFASIGINATRWAMDRADHNQGKRNVLLKTLDALGLGFDS